jgi:hypothetical protein
MTTPSGNGPRGALCFGLLLAAARSPGVAIGFEPLPVVVPDQLRAHIPLLELSGLAWAPTLDRYLAVVDDTIDLATDSRRAPFVLALNRAGHLDAEPVPLDGLSALDDAESLAAGPDGTFFLLTSHSPTHRGKIRASRRQLLRLHLDGRRLRVTGILDLLHGSADISHELKKLGLPEETPVDLEAIAFHDGALYIGLKAPLLPDGEAIILRLDRSSEAFAAGKLEANELSLWGQAKLAVPPIGGGPGPLVFQGVADLFFGPDGDLYLCANAPKNGSPDGGGALWRARFPTGGRLEAQLLRRFVGLKPEGITVRPGSGALTVVFDRNSRDPLWMTLPLGNPTDAAIHQRRQP